MRILTSKHYIAHFTVPPQARHSIQPARFVNLGRLWKPALAVAAYSPFRGFDLAHFVNQIPVALAKPWVVTFESALPRMFPPQALLRRHLRSQLESQSCLALIAMSAWALAIFKRAHADWPDLPQVLAKTRVLQPAAPPAVATPRTLKPGETLRLVFVGNNFARKGGIAVLRLARKALTAGLRIHIDIVSSKMIYSGSHTDHPNAERYAADLEGLHLPNVSFRGAMTNREVMDLMATCHLSLLPTLHDTYGFSVLEGFANGLPAITSDVCALPEFVFPSPARNANGFLLRLPRDQRGCWAHEPDTQSPEYWDMLNTAFHSMSDQALKVVETLTGSPWMLEELSQGAIASLKERHSQQKLAYALDSIYSRAYDGGKAVPVLPRVISAS